jgi:membrane protease YdiL (CAAX protease family)
MTPDRTDAGDDDPDDERTPPSVSGARETPTDAGADGDTAVEADGDTAVEADGDTDDGSPISDEARVFVHGMVAFGLTVLAIVVSGVFQVVPVVPTLVSGGDPTLPVVGASVVAGEVGFVVVAVGFLLATRRGVGYLDLDLPGSSRQWGLVVAFVVVAFVLRSVVVVGMTQAGVDPAPSQIGEFDVQFDLLAIMLIPVMLLVVGPAEELLFRGVIQKYLREATSARTAIVVAGLLFGSIHVFAVVRAGVVALVVTLGVITGVGMGLGWLYERTGSLPAAMIAHGGYNALILASAVALRAAGVGG